MAEKTCTATYLHHRSDRDDYDGRKPDAHQHTCYGDESHIAAQRDHWASCDGVQITWPVDGSAIGDAAPVVLVGSRDEPPCPDVAAVELLTKRAVEAGWVVEKRYALAAVPAIGRSPAHARHSITVRFWRTGEVDGQSLTELGYATFVRKDKAQGAGTDGVEYVEGTWGFEDAFIAGKPFGARQLPARLAAPLRLPTAPEIAEPDRPKRTTTQPMVPPAAPILPNTWGALHVGDKVRGLDGRDYYVSEALPAGQWVGSGLSEVRVTVKRADGTGDPLTYTQPAAAPVVIAERGEFGQAVDTLTDAGVTSIVIDSGEAVEETPVTTTEQIAAPTPLAEVQRGRYRSSKASSADEDGTEHDRFGRYLLPDPLTGEERSWTRASTMAKTLSDSYALTQWAKRMVAAGMALRPDLVSVAASLNPDDPDDKRRLDEVTESAMERAGSTAGRNAGDALHRALKRTIRGERLELPDAMRTDVDAALAEVARHHFTIAPELTERVVVNLELGVAGRFDLIVGQPAVRGNAPWAVTDWKTNKTLDFSWDEYAIQLAIYARSSHLWDPKTRTYLDLSTTPVDRERAILLHVPVGKGTAVAHAVDLIDGWRKAQIALTVREERKATAGHWLLEPDPATLLLHLVTKAPSTDELQALMARGQREGTWGEETQRAAYLRWEELAVAA